MEKNTRNQRLALRKMCKLGQVAAWVVIIVGLFETGAYGYAHLVAHVSAQPTLYQSMVAGSNILMGLLLLTTLQFVRYVVDEDAEPGWFLRHGHHILGVFALYLLATGSLFGWAQMRPLFHILFVDPPEHIIPMGRELGVASAFVLFLLPPLAKAICAFGAAAMVRAVLPVLAESKTLA